MKNIRLIRRALESDAKELSLMICENAKATLAPYYTKEQWDIFITYYSTEVIKNKIATQIVFCSEFNGQIIATIALDDTFVVGFYTRLEFMNKGIGVEMMNHLEEFALKKGLSEIQLNASPVGLAFYFKNGWEKIKDIIAVHYGVGFEESLMIKKLQ
jgi:GNAT superfamily N-acetyltransferase